MTCNVVWGMQSFQSGAADGGESFFPTTNAPWFLGLTGAGCDTAQLGFYQWCHEHGLRSGHTGNCYWSSLSWVKQILRICSKSPKPKDEKLSSSERFLLVFVAPAIKAIYTDCRYWHHDILYLILCHHQWEQFCADCFGSLLKHLTDWSKSVEQKWNGGGYETRKYLCVSTDRSSRLSKASVQLR